MAEQHAVAVFSGELLEGYIKKYYDIKFSDKKRRYKFANIHITIYITSANGKKRKYAKIICNGIVGTWD